MRALAAVLVVLASTSAAMALDPAAQRGFTFVETNCAMCHATGKYGESKNPLSPPFRTLHERYPVENLAEAISKGIVTGHPNMPAFSLDPGQINDVIAYLKTLE